jgi:hypothetical protein
MAEDEEGSFGRHNLHLQSSNEKKHQHQMEVIHDVNHMMRVTKSRANELNHAKCILKLTFNKFDWTEE